MRDRNAQSFARRARAAAALIVSAASTLAACGSKSGLLVCGIEASEITSALPPRPIAPWSTTTVTTQRPTFRWELPPGAHGADVLLCRDVPCASPVHTLSANGTSTRPLDALTPGVWFWRLRNRVRGQTGCAYGPIWEFTVRPRDADVDTSSGLALDIDRDGFNDLAVALFQDVDIYLGSALGLPATPLSEPFGADTTPAIATIGDFNGDGHADLRMQTWETGENLVALSGNHAARPNPLSAYAVTDVRRAGDIDRDGYADLLVNLWSATDPLRPAVVVFGFASPPAVPRTAALTAAGSATGGFDLDADGYADVVSSVARINGRIEFSAGGPTGPSSAPVGIDVAHDGFIGDTSVVDAGDVDGDGYENLLLITESGAGAMSDLHYFILDGGTNVSAFRIAAWVPRGGVTRITVPAAGDIDGDGFTDVVVPNRATPTSPVSLDVYLGGPGQLAVVPSVSFSAPYLGQPSVALSVGDVDGDGRAEVVAGIDGDSGCVVHVFRFDRPDAPQVIALNADRCATFGTLAQ